MASYRYLDEADLDYLIHQEAWSNAMDQLDDPDPDDEDDEQ